MRHPRRIMVIGGARSGKSGYAESLAPAGTHSRVYIATADENANDEEMRTRIARHRRSRGTGWKTVNAPINLGDAINEHARPGAFILVDCITLWLCNVMDHMTSTNAMEDLLQAIEQTQATLVMVSNEVGTGIVPENSLARRFRDEAGRVNQQIAAACDEVTLIVAGLPLSLKKT